MAPTAHSLLCWRLVALGGLGCRGTLRGRMALGDIDVPFVWQGVALGDIGVPGTWWALHLAGLALVARLIAWRGRREPFVSQVWHLVTSTCLLCGWGGTYDTGLGGPVTRGTTALCVQAWHLQHWAGSGGPYNWWHLVMSTYLFSRPEGTLGDIDVPGTWWALHLAGLALVARLVAWRGRREPFVSQVWHFVTSTCLLCGRGGTYDTGLGRPVARGTTALCVQAWHLQHWAGSGGPYICHGILCGRGCTW